MVSTHRPTDRILAVLAPDGAVAGTAFLAGPLGHLVTCAHVLADAGYAPGHEVTLRRSNDETVIARVGTAWGDPDREDIACLDLTVPAATPGFEFGSSAGVRPGARYGTFGFPMLMRREGMPGVIEAVGITHEGGAQALQGRSDEVSLGFSGAPVWDLDNELVIGMAYSVIEGGKDPVTAAMGISP